MSDQRFYVYALCDPRVAGEFRYEVEDGVFVEFDSEPFYVGKGTGRRMFTHVSAAKAGNRQSDENPHKTRKILAIHQEGLSVVEVKVRENLTEDQSLNLEKRLVDLLGRSCDGGILCNILHGGASGAAGKVLSEEHRKKISASRRGSPRAYEAAVQNIRKAHQLTPDQRKKKAERQKQSFAARSADDEEKRREVIGGASKKMWASRTSDERRDVIERAQAKRSQNKEFPQKMANILSARNQVKATCPHCDKTGQAVAMKRFHFDNCKILKGV